MKLPEQSTDSARSIYQDRKKLSIVLILLLLVIVPSVFLLGNNRNIAPAPTQIIEPEAPLTDKVTVLEIGEKDDQIEINQPNNPSTTNPITPTPSDSGVPNNPPVNQPNPSQPVPVPAPAPIPAPTPETTPSNPGSENKLTIKDLGEISKIKYSDDKSKMLVLSTQDKAPETTSRGLFDILIPKVHAQEESSASTLSLADNNGNIIVTVQENTVIDADFFTEDYVYYQTIGSAAGVYRYDISEFKKDIMVYTYDPKAFDNITPVDDTRYFFIQPNTGKVGFGNIQTQEINLIEEKSLNLQTQYAQSGAFRYASLSPNNQYIAFYDIADTQPNGLVKVKVYPVTATKATDIYFETYVMLIPRGLAEWENVFEWTTDSKYLIAGDNATIIDIATKTVVFSTDSNLSKVKISPNKQKLLVNDMTNNQLYLTDFAKSTKNEISKDVRQFEWVSESLAILTIGQRLYVLPIEQLKLESVNEIKEDTVILDIDENTGSAIVKQGDSLSEVTLKN